jgi:hypothetical protein
MFKLATFAILVGAAFSAEANGWNCGADNRTFYSRTRCAADSGLRPYSAPRNPQDDPKTLQRDQDMRFSDLENELHGIRLERDLGGLQEELQMQEQREQINKIKNELTRLKQKLR